MATQDFVIDNLRLKELALIVQANHRYFLEFESFLAAEGYAGISEFVNDADNDRALRTISRYYAKPFNESLLDGIARPYESRKAKWYFMAWLFRDAPAQRLGPLLNSVDGNTPTEKQVNLLNSLRKYVAPIFSVDSWKWPAFSEVMLARLEGSRRSLKGGLFENIVRAALTDVFAGHKLELTISAKEIRLNDETYDVQVIGSKGKILIPVKTRETMGGGHANLFTRDIHKAISVAHANGFECVPIVIAESWGGDLKALHCDHHIYIQLNPNQIDLVRPLLVQELDALIEVFRLIS